MMTPGLRAANQTGKMLPVSSNKLTNSERALKKKNQSCKNLQTKNKTAILKNIKF